MLAKALAHFFDAKLLLLDVNDFALKVSLTLNKKTLTSVSYCESFSIVNLKSTLLCLQIQSKYGSGSTESSVRGLLISFYELFLVSCR